MRVAFVTSGFPELSVTFILDQALSLLDRGVDLEILALRPSRAVLEGPMHEQVARYGLMDRVHYLDIPSAPARLAFAPLALARTLVRRPSTALRSLDPARGRSARTLALLHAADVCLSRSRYDIVHAHFGPLGLLAAQLMDTGALSGKLVCAFHGYDMTSYIRAHGEHAYAPLFACAALCLPISDFWRDRLQGMGCPPAKLRVQRMGIDTSAFAFAPRMPDPARPLRLVSIARLVEKKGIGYALEAVSLLRGEGVDVILDLVGDGPLRADLEQRARDLGVADHVRFLGWRDRDSARSVMDRAHILLCPSVTAADGDMEGIPMVLMEAMAMGLPVVATRHSGIPELVTHETTGLLAPERDAPALARAVRGWLDDPALAGRMLDAARAVVLESHDMGTQADTLLDIYRSL